MSFYLSGNVEIVERSAPNKIQVIKAIAEHSEACHSKKPENVVAKAQTGSIRRGFCIRNAPCLEDPSAFVVQLEKLVGFFDYTNKSCGFGWRKKLNTVFTDVSLSRDWIQNNCGNCLPNYVQELVSKREISP